MIANLLYRMTHITRIRNVHIRNEILECYERVQRIKLRKCKRISVQMLTSNKYEHVNEG